MHMHLYSRLSKSMTQIEILFNFHTTTTMSIISQSYYKNDLFIFFFFSESYNDCHNTTVKRNQFEKAESWHNLINSLGI